MVALRVRASRSRFAKISGIYGILMLILGCSGLSLAGTVSLEWDSVVGADGYRVYFSTTAGQYDPNDYFQVGRVSSTILTGLQDCTTYYLAVKAFNSAGESDSFSNEVSGWARPTLPSVVNTVRQGSQVTLEINGTNFMPGADVEISNPNVFVDSVTVSQCDTLVVGLTVEPLTANVRPAEIGNFDVSVINPDQVFFKQPGSLEVILDSARFDFNQSDGTTTNRVDGKDLVWMAKVFGVDESNALYDPDYDLDGNGAIDGTDLSYIASNMGGCWTGSNWTDSGSGWDISACAQDLK